MTLEELDGPQQPKQYLNIVLHDRGGMGEIYIGEDAISHKKVAIKVIPLSDRDELKLLKVESDIAKTLMHANIVKTYYDGIALDGATEFFYVVMEFIANGNLRKLLTKSSDLFPLDACLDYMSQLASGLAAAHHLIIHRDLKPENILVDEGVVLKLCDFGLAKFVDAKTRTQTFKGWGTYQYMAPECWKFGTNTKVMDIYSLGIIFYELLTKQTPFSGKNYNEIRDKHFYSPLPDIRLIRRDTPVRLIELVSKMTNKRPTDRYQSVEDVIDILSDISKTVTMKDSTLGSLSAQAHNKLRSIEAAELKARKEAEERISLHRLLNYSVTSLFGRVKAIVEEVNRPLERSKIQIIENINLRAESLEITFLSKTIRVNFFAQEHIQGAIATASRENVEFQKKQHGMVLQSLGELHIEKDGVILIGKAVIDEDSTNEYGFNLVLRQEGPNDPYGVWWLCWFADGAFVQRKSRFNHYPLDESHFYREFELGRESVMHVRSMQYKKLEDADIESLLKRLFD